MRQQILLMLVVLLVGSISYAAPSEQPTEPAAEPWIQHGIASRYAQKFKNRIMANKERYNPNALTCAHRFLPFGSFLWVKSATGRRVKVKVTDRGPFVKGRIIDLSYRAANLLGIVKSGIGKVTVTLCSESN